MDCNKVDIKKSSKGNDVKELQKYLAYLGFYKREIDGQCGDYTVSAIKSMQKLYSVKQDGWFGKTTCKACGINGQDISNSIQTLELKVFEDMVKRFDAYVSKNKKEPNICYIDFETKYRYVTLAKYKDMKARFDKWNKEHTSKPNFVYINLPTSGGGKYYQRAVQVLGTFSTPQDFYNKYIKGSGYIGYNNDIYTFETALQRLKKHLGLNCSDLSQLCYFIFTDMGYNCRFVHIRCKSGTGHIVLDIKYPKGVSTYTRIDPAAGASTGSKYNWGNIWCANGSIIGYNPGWLMKDDGIT